MVWKKKAMQTKPAKKVSFADPIATELRAPTPTLNDDNITLIRGNFHSEPLITIEPMFDAMAEINCVHNICVETETGNESGDGDKIDAYNNITDNSEHNTWCSPVVNVTCLQSTPTAHLIHTDAGCNKEGHNKEITKDKDTATDIIIDPLAVAIMGEAVQQATIQTLKIIEEEANLPRVDTVSHQHLPNPIDLPPDTTLAQDVVDTTLTVAFEGNGLADLVNTTNPIESHPVTATVRDTEETPVEYTEDTPDSDISGGTGPANDLTITDSTLVPTSTQPHLGDNTQNLNISSGHQSNLVTIPDHGDITPNMSQGSGQQTHIITVTNQACTEQTQTIESTEEVNAQAAPVLSSAQHQYNMTVDDFLQSIETPIQQLIIGDTPNLMATREEEEPGDPSYTSTQRQSIRLAKKAELNAGKDSTQIAHDLLVKKLGELAGEESSEEEHDFDFFAQHFQRPLKLCKMQAIQTLIEQEKKKKKGRIANRKAGTEVGLEA